MRRLRIYRICLVYLLEGSSNPGKEGEDFPFSLCEERFYCSGGWLCSSSTCSVSRWGRGQTLRQVYWFSIFSPSVSHRLGCQLRPRPVPRATRAPLLQLDSSAERMSYYLTLPPPPPLLFNLSLKYKSRYCSRSGRSSSTIMNIRRRSW